MRDIPPGWVTVIQAIAGVLMVGLLVYHGEAGGHGAALAHVDSSDLVGAGGLGLAGRVVWKLLRPPKDDPR